jgi:hypothetical protein
MKVGHRSFPRHKTVTKERIWATAELVEAGLIDVSLGDFIEVGERPEGTRKVVNVPEVRTAYQTWTPAEDTTPDRQREC